MFLIDKPFVSAFLIDTIRVNNFEIIATETAKTLINDDTLNWIEETEAISIIKNNPQTPLYTNSENALAWIKQHLETSALAQQIKVFKDKVKFRELIQNLFSDFYFKKVRLEDIHQLTKDDISFPFVIKPAVGFFSIGVHIVHDEQDWVKAKKELSPQNC